MRKYSIRINDEIVVGYNEFVTSFQWSGRTIKYTIETKTALAEVTHNIEGANVEVHSYFEKPTVGAKQ